MTRILAGHDPCHWENAVVQAQKVEILNNESFNFFVRDLALDPSMKLKIGTVRVSV